MKRAALLTLIAFVLSFENAWPQQQPYAGMQARPIKALSDEQIADLKAGNGMGLALAAELNGYPGPAHVLEFRKELALDQHQCARVQELFDKMKAETILIGEKLIGLEADLDRQFASKTVTPQTLALTLQAIGTTQGHLREAHLKYHLLTLATMTPSQVTRYAELRGYRQDSQSPQHQRRH